VASGGLESQNDEIRRSEHPRFLQDKPLTLLKRGEVLEEATSADDSRHNVSSADDDAHELVNIDSPSTSKRPSTPDQIIGDDVSVDVDASDRLREVGGAHQTITEGAISILDDSLDIYIPTSFGYQVMSPNVTHAEGTETTSDGSSSDCSSDLLSFSGDESLYSDSTETNIDSKTTIVVCDVGTQTEMYDFDLI
jgi:hypothetical protein